MNKPANQPEPTTPAAFAAAVFAAVSKGLETDQALDALKADLDGLVAKYTGRAVTVVMKSVPSRRMIYGWASVVTKDGEVVKDRQADFMDMDNLREVVHDFMSHRVGKTMHSGGNTGEIVDSFVIDAEVAAAFGVNFGCEGWMVGYKVQDDAVWKRVQSGELRAFSIGGEGDRIPLTTS